MDVAGKNAASESRWTNLQISRQTLPQADAGTRTPDPFITSEVLYQLSYVGVRGPVYPRPRDHRAPTGGRLSRETAVTDRVRSRGFRSGRASPRPARPSARDRATVRRS